MVWSVQLGVWVPLLSAVVAWYANERSKRSWEEYSRKEERYSALLRALPGFFTASGNKEQRDEFLQQVNQCWLYCPDQVIAKAYGFLQSVHEGAPTGEADKDVALGEFVAAIRQDLLARQIVRKTTLGATDFRRFASR